MGKQRKQEEKGNRGRHLRDAAVKKLARTPGAAPKMRGKTPEELVYELQVHQIELEMQNDELKKAQLALEASRDKYVDLYDFAPVGYFTFTAGALIAEVNLTGAALLGVERQKLKNGSFKRFVAPEDLDRWDRHIVSVLQHGEKQSCDLVLKRQDGSTVHARFDSVRLDLPTEKAGVSGGTPVVRTTVSDITERKRAEDALRESEGRYRILVENIPQKIFAKDRHSVYVSCNENFARDLGITPEEFAGKTDYDFFPKELADKYRTDDRRIMETGIMEAIDEKYIRDGKEIWMHTVKTPVRNEQGDVVGVLGISSDITERKRAERELQEKNAELEHFIYTIAHDLKSPLVTVKTFLGYLQQDLPGSDTERIKKDMLYMHTAADKMGQLLAELLEMSRIGRIVNPPVRVTFRELVEEALNVVAGPIAERGVKVQLSDAPITLSGDRPRLVEIWQNLVENAVKFMGDQASPQIEIGAERRGGDRVFFVRDNGMGIDPRCQVKVFDLFEKIDSKSEGAGLGLALVKRIVELYRGTIWLESKGLGQGACFLFTLPGAVKDKDQEEGEKS